MDGYFFIKCSISQAMLEHLEHGLLRLSKKLCIEGTHFINNTLIASCLHERFNTLDVDWCDEWIIRSSHRQLKSAMKHINSVSYLLTIQLELDSGLSIRNLAGCLAKLLDELSSWTDLLSRDEYCMMT
ncbi:hypothetical protein Tco_1559770 [Tanacetum coccineum]